jgi:hypothetical protein
MTDAPNRKEDVQRILDYAEAVAKESRRALTVEFNQQHKGIAFSKAAQVLQDSFLAWFNKRDKNLKVTYEQVTSARLGEIRAVFVGESKKVRFKLHADAVFTLAGGAADSPSYLKELNVTVDKRAFPN